MYFIILAYGDLYWRGLAMFVLQDDGFDGMRISRTFLSGGMDTISMPSD